ncbi:MAG: hypothetical protein KAU50_09295, partial [Candidatus Marinimicrobia bacterium]|nr:hypothetical protein [Candidatus Neomarinimicrobiota bacterium]
EAELSGSKELVASEEYKERYKSTETPVLANKFLCLSLLLENSSAYNEAGWAALHAAWVVDDMKGETQASSFRRRAIDLWMQAQKAGQVFMEGDGAEDTLLTDLYRRIGDWKEAASAAERGLYLTTDETISTILKFEESMIDQKDRQVYTVKDAFG